MDADDLVAEHVGLPRRVVLDMATGLPRHTDLDDLIGAGMLGLHQAARSFDPGRGVPFSAFARRRIHGAVLDALRGVDVASRTDRHRIRAVTEATDALVVELGRSPTTAELSDRTGMSPKTIDGAHVDGHRATVLHLDSVVEDANASSALADPGLDPAERLVDAERQALAVDALEALPERLRYVVAATVLGNVAHADVAAQLGVTESRISQMLAEGLALMQDAIQAHLDGPASVVELGDGRRDRRIARYRLQVAAGPRHKPSQLRAA